MALTPLQVNLEPAVNPMDSVAVSAPSTQVSRYPKSQRAAPRRGPHRMVPDIGGPVGAPVDGGFTARSFPD